MHVTAKITSSGPLDNWLMHNSALSTMDNNLTNQNLFFLAFVSGVAVGCALNTILGLLLSTVTECVDCNRRRKKKHRQQQQEQRRQRQQLQRLSKRRTLYYTRGAKKEKEEDVEEGRLSPLSISDPVLESTTFPIASVSPRHSATFFTATPASKPLAEWSERRPAKSTRPLLREEGEDFYSSPATGKPRLFINNHNSNNTLDEGQNFYSLPPTGKPRLYTTTTTATSYNNSNTPEGGKDFYSSPPPGKPRLSINNITLPCSCNNDTMYLPKKQHSEGSNHVEAPIYANIRATEENDEGRENLYETIPAEAPAAATAALETAQPTAPSSLRPPSPPVPDFSVRRKFSALPTIVENTVYGTMIDSVRHEET